MIFPHLVVHLEVELVEVTDHLELSDPAAQTVIKKVENPNHQDDILDVIVRLRLKYRTQSPTKVKMIILLLRHAQGKTANSHKSED